MFVYSVCFDNILKISNTCRTSICAVIFLLAESFDSINFSCLSCFSFYYCFFAAVLAVINLHAIMHAVMKEGLLKGHCHAI